jgi:uncharacterized protein (DUF2062 family)
VCAHGANRAPARGPSISPLDVVAQVVALLLALILLAVGLIHAYWALGGRRASAGAVPEVAGRPAFKPSRFGTIAVAIALLAASALVATAGRLLADPLSPPIVRLLTFGLGAVFLARSVGDFRLVGFFKRVRASRFAQLDTFLYSPLCLIMGLAALFVAYHDV